MFSLLPWRPDPDKLFSDELDAFFNHAVINFDIQPLELYKSRIITSYMYYKNLITIDTTSGKPVPPSEQVKTILTHLFSPDSRARYKSIPTGMSELQVSNVFSSRDITDFPTKLASLASAYYLLPNIQGFTYSGSICPSKADQLDGATFDTSHFNHILVEWLEFLTECISFSTSYGDLPPRVNARLYAFNSNRGIPENDELIHMIEIITQLKDTGTFPGCSRRPRGGKIIRRKRSTRNRNRIQIQGRTRNRDRGRSRSRSRNRKR